MLFTELPMGDFKIGTKSNNVKMITYTIILSSLCVVFAHFEGPLAFQKRYKRDAVGTLDIVTNNAQPIHADVKQENLAENEITTTSATEKLPVNETATGDGPTPVLVTPPKDVALLDEKYGSKSLRKSLPLFTRLDLIRSISRIVTLSVVIISALIEIYPLIRHLCNISDY